MLSRAEACYAVWVSYDRPPYHSLVRHATQYAASYGRCHRHGYDREVHLSDEWYRSAQGWRRSRGKRDAGHVSTTLYEWGDTRRAPGAAGLPCATGVAGPSREAARH